MKNQTDIVPVLLGADLNCYNVARAFHMQYGIKSYAFGRYAVSATKYSKIINFKAIPDIDTDDKMVSILRDFARSHESKKLILFGCTDDYVSLIIRHKSELPEYVIPYPSEDILSSVSKKSEFYQVCDKFGIPYPKTIVISEKTSAAELTGDKLSFSYPLIIKPSSSIEYWKNPFDGMKKVYISNSPDESSEIINKIYSSGYADKIIIQEMIDGGDCQMRVLTTFSDKNGKVRAMCLGHTMLEEHTPKGIGNHAAIVTESVPSFPLAPKIKKMLEDMGYTGFANFDIKLRSNTSDDYRVFEINLRQGRSNFYLTAAGLNVAYLAAEVFDSDTDDCISCEKSVFWHHIPKSVAYKYTEDPELIKKAKELSKNKLSASSVWYAPDLCLNPLRLACVIEQLRRQKSKFKKYYPKNKQV